MDVPVLEGVPPGVNVFEGDAPGLADRVSVAVRVFVPDADDPGERVRVSVDVSDPAPERVRVVVPEADPTADRVRVVVALTAQERVVV